MDTSRTLLWLGWVCQRDRSLGSCSWSEEAAEGGCCREQDPAESKGRVGVISRLSGQAGWGLLIPAVRTLWAVEQMVEGASWVKLAEMAVGVP